MCVSVVIIHMWGTDGSAFPFPFQEGRACSGRNFKVLLGSKAVFLVSERPGLRVVWVGGRGRCFAQPHWAASSKD